MRSKMLSIMIFIIVSISPFLSVSSAGYVGTHSQITLKDGSIFEISNSGTYKIADHVIKHLWLNTSTVHYFLYSTNTHRFVESFLLIYSGIWSNPIHVGGAYPHITAYKNSVMVTSSVNGTLHVFLRINNKIYIKSLGNPWVTVSAGYLKNKTYVVWRENNEVFIAYFQKENFTPPMKIATEQYPVRKIFTNGTQISLLEEGLHEWANITYVTKDYSLWKEYSQKIFKKSSISRTLGSIFPTQMANWTFMVYMDADNSLGGSSDTLNIRGMEEGFNSSADGKVNVIVLWDGPENGDTKLLSIHYGGYTDISSSAPWLSPEVDMANPETLINFVNWTETNYPAHHYFLDMWDHGGDYSGAIYDATSGDIMNLTELHSAALGILKITGKPVDIWGYDACLMDAGADNYQIKEAANIILASEHTEGADGWNYENVIGLLTSNPDMSPTEFAYQFVNVVDPTHTSIVTIVALNVTAWDYYFMPAYNGLAQALRQNAGTYNNEIRDAMSNAATADSQYWTSGKDVGDFAKNLYLNVNASSVKYWAARLLENVSKSVINYYDYDTNGRKIIMAESDSTYQVSQHLSAQIFQDYEWDEMLNQVYLNGTDDKNVAPTCTITSSTPASLPQNSHLLINGTASDPDGSVERVEMKIDRGNWVPISGTTAWSVNLSLLNFSVGEHYLFFRSYDGDLYSNVTHVKIQVTLRTDLPDLKFVSVIFTTTEPYEGMNIGINVTITNDGNNSSYDVPVGIYLDRLSPDAQILIYNYGNLSIGEEKWHVFVWNT
ncbi:MAG: hypothetical protein GXO25_08125, partial [Euryarchaeota archaeon]|nr:hypothetical protein [Euryarchaeota archaeon]